MILPNISEETARASFSPSAWSQGEAYLASRAVTLGTWQDTAHGFEMTAEVRRSARRSYRVTLVCDRTGTCQWGCICPFEAGGGCAHCAAVVILWCRQPELFHSSESPAVVTRAAAASWPVADAAVRPGVPAATTTVPATAPRAALWVATDGTICGDLAGAGESGSRLQAALGEHLTTASDSSYVTLSALGFANALQQGVTAAQVLAALADATAGSLPPAVAQQIDRWVAASDNLHLYDSLCIVEFADDFILQELLRVSGLRHYLIHIFSPRVIAVQPKQVAALVADLETRGYMPKVEHT